MSDLTASAASLVASLKTLRQCRERRKDAAQSSRLRRPPLSPRDRATVLEKTGGRCHICGGGIANTRWQADHVLAHSGGGGSSVENFLPAHALCNNYRWDYLPEEFALILKIGVWARTQMERETPVGRQIVSGFTRHERGRVGRQKAKKTVP